MGGEKSQGSQVAGSQQGATSSCRRCKSAGSCDEMNWVGLRLYHEYADMAVVFFTGPILYPSCLASFGKAQCFGIIRARALWFSHGSPPVIAGRYFANSNRIASVHRGWSRSAIGPGARHNHE